MTEEITELLCDICNKHMGWVVAHDNYPINCNCEFICDFCRTYRFISSTAAVTQEKK